LNSNITDGLLISAIGIAVAFTFMGIFILTMVVLQRLFPAKKEDITIVTAEPVAAEPILITIEEDDEEQAIVAAIVVAMNHARAQRMSTLGSGLEAGRGVWWVANQMAARQNGEILRRSAR
jgi:Na+-transporting methylmalonyl-CoA/oxaloacetate decarboxylase gamma subunit